MPFGVFAAEEMGMLFGGPGGGPRKAVDYAFQGTPASGGSPSIQEHSLRARFALVQNSTVTWAVYQQASLFDLNHPLTIPENGLSIPETMGSIETGATYLRILPGKRTLGITASIGSASDQLFYSRHELIANLTVTYRRPSGPRNAWITFLNYSNHREFLNNVPIPGIGYYWQTASRKWRVAAGFPFIVALLLPSPTTDARFMLFGPRRMGLEAGWRFKGQSRLYGGWEWGAQEWLLANRINTDNRLFFDRKRLQLGVQWPLIPQLSLDLSGGREFDRRFFENRSSKDNVPTLGLHPTWYGLLKVALRL